MNLTDSDIEFILRLYVIGKEHMVEKDMQDYANAVVSELAEYGMKMKNIAEELSDFDHYLANACEEYLEEDEDDEDFYDQEEEDY